MEANRTAGLNRVVRAPKGRLLMPRAAFEGGEDVFFIVSGYAPLALPLPIQFQCHDKTMKES
ncbi:MAG: hypothetical protein QOF62_2266 [Pyrinomonadaceae bacterium]|jgi:hypothetical protein|nr:hypothetical protein [Pyrinomonadaceae bacterium]